MYLCGRLAGKDRPAEDTLDIEMAAAAEPEKSGPTRGGGATQVITAEVTQGTLNDGSRP